METEKSTRRYGRYEIVEQVGKGAMGVVYKAHDPQINRMVALKVLREDRVTSQDFVQRFLREAMAIGRLSHPNIVTVYDIGSDHGTVYIAMEFLEGIPLNEAIHQQKPDPQWIAGIAVQLAESLAYAHSRGIVHRDIKPSNIILNPDGQVKITDFGIAHIEDPEMTQQTHAGQILGTPIYMSPEQVAGSRLDGRSDLYSLSVILYEITVGRRPYSGENITAIFRAITQDNPQPPAEADPEVPGPLSDLIMKGMHKDIEARFQSGGDMAAAFRNFLRQAERQDFAPALPEKAKSGSWMAAVLLVAVIVIGAGGYLLFSHKQDTAPAGEAGTSVQAPVEKALLNLGSDPQGAQVFIDNSLEGTTPLSLEVPLGKHEIRMSLPDFNAWEAQIDLDKTGEVPLFVRLEPAEGE